MQIVGSATWLSFLPVVITRAGTGLPAIVYRYRVGLEALCVTTSLPQRETAVITGLYMYMCVYVCVRVCIIQLEWKCKHIFPLQLYVCVCIRLSIALYCTV